MQGMFDVGLSVWVKTRLTTASAVFYFQGRSFDFVGVLCTCFGLGFWHLGFWLFVFWILAFGLWAFGCLGFGRLGIGCLGFSVWASVFGLQCLGFSVWASVWAFGVWPSGVWDFGVWAGRTTEEQNVQCLFL